MALVICGGSCIVHSPTVLIRGRRGRFGVHHGEHEQEEKGRCK